MVYKTIYYVNLTLNSILIPSAVPKWMQPTAVTSPETTQRMKLTQSDLIASVSDGLGFLF